MTIETMMPHAGFNLEMNRNKNNIRCRHIFNEYMLENISGVFEGCGLHNKTDGNSLLTNFHYNCFVISIEKSNSIRCTDCDM